MARVIDTVEDAINYINILSEGDDSAPTSSDTDFTVWLGLLNIAINIWENEEGMLWRELFVKLSDATTGDDTTDGGNSYDCPDDFVFPASGYVWLGSGTGKKVYEVISQEEVQLREADSSNWCYFLMDTSPTLEFNPNITIPTGLAINYSYYKTATKLTNSASTFEMSDPMFAVYYALSELRKDEGDTSALTIATQKLEGMKTKNIMPSYFQNTTTYSPKDDGFGV